MEAIAPVLSLVGSFMSMRGEEKGADAQERVAAQQQAAAEESRRLAQRNAAAIEAETAESVRQEKLAAKDAEATRRARAAASGGTIGSFSPFLEEQSAREQGYIDWLGRSGASRASLAAKEGDIAFMQGSAAAEGTKAEAKARKSQARAGFLTSAASAGGDLWSMFNTGGGGGKSMPWT